MRQSYVDHREGVICETKKPNMQLSHQIYQPSYNSKQIPSWWPFTKSNPLPSAISSTCRLFIVLYKIPIRGVKIHLVLAAQSPSPENKFNHCFFFSLLPFFSFPLLFAFYFLFCRECQGRSQPIVL